MTSPVVLVTLGAELQDVRVPFSAIRGGQDAARRPSPTMPRPAACGLTCLGHFGQEEHQPAVLLVLLVLGLSPATKERDEKKKKKSLKVEHVGGGETKTTPLLIQVFKPSQAAHTWVSNVSRRGYDTRAAAAESARG